MTNAKGMTKLEGRTEGSTLFRHSTACRCFVIRHSWLHAAAASHMFDYVIAKLRAFDFSRAVHQAREIVRDAFAGDRAA
jgi:hypothetical protein